MSQVFHTPPYWKWDKIIPEEMLQLLDAEIEQLEFQDGKLIGEVTKGDVRNSKMVPMPPWHWLAGILYNYAVHANISANWGRTITRPEVLQIASYREDEFYRWHSDTDFLLIGPENRKLTAICLLSDPTEFEGGEFQIEGVEEKIDLQRGSVIVFPSPLVHQVTPVTSGERRSATVWALGPNKW